MIPGYERLAAREAMRLHYARSSLPADGGGAATQWTLALGPFSLRLSNFKWRRRALPFHDLHHLLTDYPCTPAGEFQMAAWEFAAGRFPSALSTVFCLPLIAMGAMTMPARSFAAFVRGRRSRTLYATPWTEDPFELSIRELRDRVLPRIAPAATAGDLFRYLGLVSSSLALIAFPILILSILFLSRG